jgi:hypothetical protein
MAAGAIACAFNVAMTARSVRVQRRSLARLTEPDSGMPIDVRARYLRAVQLVSYEDDWALRVPHETAHGSVRQFLSAFRSPREDDFRYVTITAAAALRVAAKVLPAINQAGGSAPEVRSAVELIEQSENAHALFSSFVVRRKTGYGKSAPRVDVTRSIVELSAAARLALEMATHEDAERRALEGELHLLEDAWKEAEEIAAIADDLLVPAADRRRLAAMKNDN